MSLGHSNFLLSKTFFGILNYLYTISVIFSEKNAHRRFRKCIIIKGFHIYKGSSDHMFVEKKPFLRCLQEVFFIWQLDFLLYAARCTYAVVFPVEHVMCAFYCMFKFIPIAKWILCFLVLMYVARNTQKTL